MKPKRKSKAQAKGDSGRGVSDVFKPVAWRGRDLSRRPAVNLRPAEILAIFDLLGLYPGRCLGSKSGYRKLFQPNRFVPNANIFTTPGSVGNGSGKIWYGDLDILRDEKALSAVSRLLNRKLFILWEFDGRWGREAAPHSEIIRRAVATVWHGQVSYSAAANADSIVWR